MESDGWFERDRDWIERGKWDEARRRSEIEREVRSRWNTYRAARDMALYGEAFYDQDGNVIPHSQIPADRLAGGGGYEGPRHNRVPLPVEITSVIADAEQATKMAASGFGLAPCGAQAPGTVSGTDIRCDRLQGHTAKIKHRNRETGFSWWGEH